MVRDIVSKVQTGRFTLIKNISNCEIDRDKVKLYRLKDGEELLVDKELDERLLDNINANKHIEVETICSGHDKGFPTIGFDYKGKHSIHEVKDILGTIPDTNIIYDSQTIRAAIPIKNEPKIKRNGEEYTLCGIEEVHQNYFFIRGTRKGSKTWWNKVSNTLSKLK